MFPVAHPVCLSSASAFPSSSLLHSLPFYFPISTPHLFLSLYLSYSPLFLSPALPTLFNHPFNQYSVAPLIEVFLCWDRPPFLLPQLAHLCLYVSLLFLHLSSLLCSFVFIFSSLQIPGFFSASPPCLSALPQPYIFNSSSLSLIPLSPSHPACLPPKTNA